MKSKRVSELLGEALEDLKAVVEGNFKLFSELQKLKISISNFI
jgi:hypothetical protein